MTLFIDLRATPSGGVCAREATLWLNGTKPVSQADFADEIRGRDLVLAAHGFNVSRSGGVASLSLWAAACQLKLPPACLFIGVLWPGDSKYFSALSYPWEGDEAIASGRLLAAFLNKEAGQAASLSFVSHSLGTRTMLEAVQNLRRKARCLVLMAGAIEDDCLDREYRAAAENAEKICTLASRKDWVLQLAYPVGDLIGQIVRHGHPHFEAALGRNGPENPIPSAQRGGAWQIPKPWDYKHGDYLPGNPVPQSIPVPVQAPQPQSAAPSNAPEWKPEWSASVVATQVS
jgi:hypothetical protein